VLEAGGRGGGKEPAIGRLLGKRGREREEYRAIVRLSETEKGR